MTGNDECRHVRCQSEEEGMRVGALLLRVHVITMGVSDVTGDVI